MGVIPTTRDAMLTWFNERIQAWQTSAALIGLDPLVVDAFKSELDAVNAKAADMFDLRTDARIATETTNAAAAELRSSGAALVAMIKAFAEQTGNDNVFQLSKIPMPKPPTPAPAPVAPEKVTADPNATGTITLKIKGSIAQNGSFRIERSIDGGAWAFLDNTRLKTWTDDAVPMNITTINYRVFGVRESKRSQTATGATVNFGTLPPALQAAFRSDDQQAAQAA